MSPIIAIAILIISVVIHEVSHGYMADRLGDPTARLQGRLTINPVKHLDPVGSVVVPLMTSFFGFTFGWAKPVPYNPYNLQNRRVGEFLIAIVGPISNICIALIFSLAIRLAPAATSMAFIEVAAYVVIINLVLAIFNLIPLPPLDGSKLLFAFLPNQYGRTRILLETYAPILILVFILFIWRYVSPIIWPIFSALTGIQV